MRGEEAACRYLTQREYHLLHRNWRCGHLEIDIVADDYGEIVFVEVKTRANEDRYQATDAVDLKKMENLLQAAKAYMAAFHLDQPYRFDIITVVGEEAPYQISHLQNAFTPAGVWERKRNHQNHL